MQLTKETLDFPLLCVNLGNLSQSNSLSLYNVYVIDSVLKRYQVEIYIFSFQIKFAALVQQGKN